MPTIMAKLQQIIVTNFVYLHQSVHIPDIPFYCFVCWHLCEVGWILIHKFPLHCLMKCAVKQFVDFLNCGFLHISDPEGIKGAEATASAIFMARSGSSKEDIKAFIIQEFGYDLSRTCDEIRPTYHHVESCQQTVPEAIICRKGIKKTSGYVPDALRPFLTAYSIAADGDDVKTTSGRHWTTFTRHWTTHFFI